MTEREAPLWQHLQSEKRARPLRVLDAIDTFADEETAAETEQSRMEMHHRIATLAVGLERVAESPEQLAAYLAELANEPIPEMARMRLAHVAEQYRTAVDRAIDAARTLGLDVLDEVAMGKKLFYAVTGFFPAGLVTAKRHEGYFILVCKDKGDFGIASTAGMRTTSSKYETAGGVYHRALSTYLDESRLSVITCRSDEEQGVFIHERQHWINDKLFSRFIATERGVPNQPPSREQEEQQRWLYAIDREFCARDIKDEMLAYLREGRNGFQIAKTLTTSPLYSELFKKEPVHWKTVVAQVTYALDTYLLPHFHERDARGVLTAHLASVPLEKMSTAIKKLGRYYGERKAFVNGEWDERLVEAAGRADRVVHPDIVRDVHELSTLIDQHSTLRKAATTAAIGSDGVFVSHEALADQCADLRDVRDSALRAFASLRSREASRGARFPSIWNIEVAGTDQEKQAERLGESLVVALEKIPLSVVDVAYDEAKRHHVDHRTQQLAARIAADFHAATGHTFVVDIGEPFNEPKQFSIHITQAASDTLAEVTYIANLYCSETPAN